MLPLQFIGNDSVESLGITGKETYALNNGILPFVLRQLLAA